MILLRTEHHRPAVFIEHLSHCARLSVKTLKSCTVLADIQWTLYSNSSERAYGTTKRLVITCNYGSNPSCKLSRWETAGMLCGSNPRLSNSTAKIKHCYGVIAGALGIVGNFYRMAVADSCKSNRRKLYPRWIRRDRDCSSRSVADSALEVEWRV